MEVTAAHDRLNLCFVWSTGRFVFAHQVTQLLLADDRIDDITHEFIRVLKGHLSYLVEQTGLACDTLEVFQEDLVDTLLGGDTNLMYETNEQVNQAVGYLVASQRAESCNQGYPYGAGMAPHLSDRLACYSISIALQQSGRDSSEEVGQQAGRDLSQTLQFGDLSQHTVQPNTSRISLEVQECYLSSSSCS